MIHQKRQRSLFNIDLIHTRFAFDVNIKPMFYVDNSLIISRSFALHSFTEANIKLKA